MKESALLKLYDDALLYAKVVRIDVGYDGKERLICDSLLDGWLVNQKVDAYIEAGLDTSIALSILQEEFNIFLAKYGA